MIQRRHGGESPVAASVRRELLGARPPRRSDAGLSRRSLARSRPATRPAKPFTSAAELHAHRRATHGQRLVESSPEHGRRDASCCRAAAAVEPHLATRKRLNTLL